MAENHVSAPPQTQTRQPPLPDTVPAQEVAALGPALTTMSGLLSLQRTIGNRAVQRLMNTGKTGVIQRAADDPATRQQILTAMQLVLHQKVNAHLDEKFAAWKSTNEPQYSALRREWDFENHCRGLFNTCFQQTLTPLFQPECLRVYNALVSDQYFDFNLTEADVVPPASMNDGMISYLFSLLSGETLFDTTMPQEVTATSALCDAYVAKAVIVKNISVNKRRDFTAARTKLEDSMADYNATLLAAQKLGLVTLTNDITAKYQHGQNVLGQNTAAGALQIIGNAITTNRNNAANTMTGPIIQQIGAMENTCYQARVAYRKSSNRLSPDNIAAINQAMNNGGRTQRMINLLGIYGTVLFDAFIGMDLEAQQYALDNCVHQDLVNAMKIQCIPGATTVSAMSKLLARIGVKLTGGAAIFGLIQQLNMPAPSIDVPGGVAVDSWKMVGGNLVPASFSTNILETDSACLKHVKEENGVNPSKRKLEAYYGELVEACTLARGAWAAAHRPAENASEYQLDVGHWRIRVKTQDGEAQIYHVDSHYENSAWVNEPN